MRIAIYHTTLPRTDKKSGGVSVVVDRLAEEMSKHHDVTVYTLDEKPELRNYKVKRLFNGSLFLRDNPIGRTVVLPILLNFISFKKYDVVNFHGDDWFYFSRNVPTVRVMHGSAKNESMSATSLKRKLLQAVIYYLEILSLKLSTIGVAGGPDAKRIYKLDYIVSYGVYTENFYPSKKTTEPTIFFIGTWEGRKRGKFIYDEFVNKVLPNLPTSKLMMVSDAAQEHPSVELFKNPDDEVVGKLMREAWIFGFPSTYEGFGVPYIEAMASKTAIVTSDNPGARYILGDGKLGMIVDDRDFANTLINLITDKNGRLDLEDKGYDESPSFSWPAVSKNYIEIYNTAIRKFNK